MKELKSYISKVKCLECNSDLDFHVGIDRCSVCDGVWLDARYDYETVADIWKSGLQGRASSLWRYYELLPAIKADKIITMGQGKSPLIKAAKIQKRLNHPAIFIKDERQSPTSSFKDRQASVAVTAMNEAGIKECVLTSTGNAAAAYAAYCARADIKLWIFLTSMVPSAKMREAALYGAEVIKVTGTYDQAKKIAADFAARRNIYLDKGAKSIPGKESMKTIAFEIAEELARQYRTEHENSTTCWKAPDWFIQAVSGGIGPIGVQKGFEELYKMGLTDRIPKIGVVQVDGCSPMVQAFMAGKAKATPVIPETRITVLSTGDPGFGYELLYKANKTYGGYMLSVSDEEAFDAMRLLAKTEGFSVEPATAVAFAGLDQMVRQGVIKQDELVVINCSGHTFPVEKYIISEDDVLNISLSRPNDSTSIGTVPTDGLVSALEHLDEQITTIVVIDDDPVDSRLIRRILQAKKPYRVFESNNAFDGLAVIKERLPDLIVSDLSMPGMDGFALLEELKKDPLTANIPVIIVSAKDLSPEDKELLSEQASSIWLKGSFSTSDLVEHVVGTLSNPEDEKTISQGGQVADTAVMTNEKKTEQSTSTKVENAVSSPNIKKLVLVEDNPLDARLISRILQVSHPMEIKQVQFGQEAVAVIKREQPDLIILDLMIPDMSGFQILEALNKEGLETMPPIIIMTGKIVSEKEKQWLTANGVVALWEKSELNREKLLADINSILT